MERAIVYIDGLNLYFGMRSKGWKRFFWLNLHQLAQNLLKPTQTLVTTKFFTTMVSRPPDKQRRQSTYVEALRTLGDVQIHLGHYLADSIVCRQCGHTYTTHHEKMSDVNIAVELLTDAFQNAFDVALLVSADGDLVGPVMKVKQLFPQKRVVVVFPPKRHSNALKNVADAIVHLDRTVLARSVFPDTVVKSDGFALHRPAQWQ